MKTAKEYRKEAKAALKGKWGIAIAITLLFEIIFAGCTATIVGAILLGGALTVGLSFTMCQLYRRGNLALEDMFVGFRSESFVATIGCYVLSTIYTFLWTLLFIIPGIIASYRYAMAPYILADHPEMSGDEAITASKMLMKGKKWKLFCLEFSFLGWLLLSCLTFGILLFWIIPWMNAAEAAFYESIKSDLASSETI